MLYHQTTKRQNDTRLTVLSKVVDKYDYTDINYPASYDDIASFEERNQVCIYVYTLTEENKPIQDKAGNTNYILNECIYLLRIENEEQSHYVYFKNVGSFLNLHHHKEDQGKILCPICQGKHKPEEWRAHVSKCYKFAKDGKILKLPELEVL